MTVLPLFARMGKQHVKFFGNPDLLIEHSFSHRVRVCISLKLLNPFLLTSVCSNLCCWSFFYMYPYRSNNKSYCSNKSFQCNKTLPWTNQVLVYCVWCVSCNRFERKFTAWISQKFVVAVIFPDSVPSYFQFCFYTIQKKSTKWKWKRENLCPFPFPRTNCSHKIYEKSCCTIQACAVCHTKRRKNQRLKAPCAVLLIFLTQLRSNYRTDCLTFWKTCYLWFYAVFGHLGLFPNCAASCPIFDTCLNYFLVAS